MLDSGNDEVVQAAVEGFQSRGAHVRHGAAVTHHCLSPSDVGIILSKSAQNYKKWLTHFTILEP